MKVKTAYTLRYTCQTSPNTDFYQMHIQGDKQNFKGLHAVDPPECLTPHSAFVFQWLGIRSRTDGESNVAFIFPKDDITGINRHMCICRKILVKLQRPHSKNRSFFEVHIQNGTARPPGILKVFELFSMNPPKTKIFPSFLVPITLS